jgi:hypothetical protein
MAKNEWRRKMGSFAEAMLEYKRQLAGGVIQQAYRGLMEYMLGLKTHFRNKYPESFVSGSLYQGTMDMTYFSLTPLSLKSRKLKIAIVFVYEAFRFEVWLSGYNRQVQARYWEQIKETGWDRYSLVPNPTNADAVLMYTLVENPDFGNLNALTDQIEQGTLAFIRDVEAFLATVQD